MTGTLSDQTGPSPDRRRFPRYRLASSISIRKAAGDVARGMTLEISEAGMSVTTTLLLAKGDTVEIEPVIQGKAVAVVRHAQGRIYGLEFVDITTSQLEGIRRACTNLPLFRPGSLRV